MADHLTAMEQQILDKDKAAVEALLGRPLKTSYWKGQRPPEGADAAAIAAFEAEQLDEIWIYTQGRVHFTIAGKAVRVDDKVAFDLPPEEDPVLMV